MYMGGAYWYFPCINEYIFIIKNYSGVRINFCTPWFLWGFRTFLILSLALFQGEVISVKQRGVKKYTLKTRIYIVCYWSHRQFWNWRWPSGSADMIILLEVMNLFLTGEGCCEYWRPVIENGFNFLQTYWNYILFIDTTFLESIFSSLLVFIALKVDWLIWRYVKLKDIKNRIRHSQFKTMESWIFCQHLLNYSALKIYLAENNFWKTYYRV